MMRRRYLMKATACVFAVFMAAHVAFAATTGKIAGVVTEKETGNPLPGANVIIPGTTMGAASDMQGNYTILHVPPGVYDVMISVIGYTRVTVQEVRVRIDQTTRLDFELESETLMGEAVSVVAERKVVKEDVSSSVTSVSAEEVRDLPISTIQQVIGLQAGVEDGLVIRGGDADAALFQVDGVTLRDPRNNQPITGIALSAVQEISIERGGFNAEYGQVRSGVVNVVTREGSKKGYEGTVTLKYSPPQAKHFGVSPFDAESMWMRPYLDDAVCWTGTESGAWDVYEQRQYPRFDGWNQISRNLLSDDDPANDLTPQGAQRLWQFHHRRRPLTDQPDYNIDAGFGGPVPFIGEKLGGLRFFTSYRRQREMLLIPLSRDDYLDWDWSLQLTSDIRKSMKLRFSAMTGKSYNVAINATDYIYYGPGFGRTAAPYWNPTDFMRTPFEIAKMTDEQRPGRIFVDSWYCPAEVGYLTLAAKFTHMLGARTFYEAGIEHIRRSYHTEPIRNRDLTPQYEIVPGYFVDEAPSGFHPDPETGLDGMFFGGHTSTVRDYSNVSATTLKFDLTSQVNPAHMIKTGAEFVVNALDLEYGEINSFTGGMNYVERSDKPYRGAVYAQDKLETKGFIVNLGLRLDFSNANTDWIIQENPFYRNYYSSRYNSDEEHPMTSPKVQWSLSPRLGISHPITENSKLFFNYGHFKQLPSYEQMFREGRGASGRINNIGDPNLILAKTVSYELGFDWGLFNTYLIQLAAFYHDITDQQAYTQYISADASMNYFKATNTSYEDIRGFELNLQKRVGRWWTAFANYTYQVSTSGHFGSGILYEDPAEQLQYDRETRNLYQERPIPRPYARVQLSLHTPTDFGPQVLAGRPLSGWTASFVGNWRSGGWYSWNPNAIRAVAQNVRIRDYHNITLRMNKTFRFNRFQCTVFAEIENLLNTRRLSGAGFDNADDERFYMESLHLPASNAYNNIVGTDKVGAYRKDGVDFRPIERVGSLDRVSNPSARAVYYLTGEEKYMKFTDDAWQEVPTSEMNQILKDKAYIDMPNQTSFNFLNPRQVFFGIRTSFDLN